MRAILFAMVLIAGCGNRAVMNEKARAAQRARQTEVVGKNLAEIGRAAHTESASKNQAGSKHEK